MEFEPERLRSDIYDKIKAFEIRNNNLPQTLGALQNTLKEEMDINNPNRINRDDFITKDFNYNSIHSKI